jgi:hypothetical protein
MGVPIAHVAGIPIEETIGIYGPAFLLAFGAACSIVRTRFRRVRDGRGSDRRTDGPGPESTTPETKTRGLTTRTPGSHHD